MTREEARHAMREGKKVTHTYFSSEEWVTMDNGLILFEDGVRCSSYEFWRWREDSIFDDGWEFFKK